MGDPLRAGDAWAMGNLGLSSALSGDPDLDSYGDEDIGDPVPRSRWRWRLLRWSLAAGSYMAFVNHWPKPH